MKNIYSLILGISLAAALGACSSTPPSPAPTATPSSASKAPAPAAAEARSSAAPASTVTSVTLPPHRDPANAIFRERSIFFDYDDFSIKPIYGAIVERHGKYLQSNTSLSVRIEGNADERGSPEYNLALGQKRAEAVVRALRIYGVKDTQMEAVSYGEERPRAAGHDESAWSQNRRADIVYRN
jgi:peptidoglycan-associated lipoprotein